MHGRNISTTYPVKSFEQFTNRQQRYPDGISEKEKLGPRFLQRPRTSRNQAEVKDSAHLRCPSLRRGQIVLPSTYQPLNYYADPRRSQRVSLLVGPLEHFFPSLIASSRRNAIRISRKLLFRDVFTK